MLPHIIIISLLQALLATAGKLKPASYYFDICNTSQPNYNECVTKSLMKLKPYLVKGISDLNIASFEPLVIPKLELGDGSGNFQLHQVLTNLHIYGLSNYRVEDISMDIANGILNYTIFYPKLDFEGDYELNGQILVLPVKGNGVVTFNFTDVTTKSFVRLEEFKKGGKTYLRIKDYKLHLEPQHATSYFTNLFNGDKLLGDSTNKFLNDNWRDAFSTYKELPEKAFSEFIKSVANRVYSFFPKDELYPK